MFFLRQVRGLLHKLGQLSHLGDWLLDLATHAPRDEQRCGHDGGKDAKNDDDQHVGARIEGS